MEKKYFFKNTWESVEFLGSGSFGKVYKAKKVDDEIEQFSAIKEITIPSDIEIIKSFTTEGLTSVEIDEELSDIKNKFINEIKVMYELKSSDNIVKIEDFEELCVPVENENYTQKYVINIRMELLKSIDEYFLDDELKDKEIIKMGLDILGSLKECKKNKIIHRDIKPENIFVNKKGVYKLGDFGEAKNLSKTISNMSKKGTENYMSPEIYKGESADLTSDIYSLGIVLYRFFNNKKLPFLPLTNKKINSKIREEALLNRINGEELPKPVNASDEVANIILKMCAYKKEDRYQNLDILINELNDVFSSIKKSKNIFTPIDSEEDKTISLYEKRKKTKVEVLELTKKELKEGCIKNLTIDNKEYEVKVPSNSKIDDEIILEVETIDDDNKKEKISIVVVLALLPMIPINTSGESPIKNIKKSTPPKKIYKPKDKGLVFKLSKGKIIGFSITSLGIVVLGIVLLNNKPIQKNNNSKTTTTTETTAKILTCNEIEQEVSDPQKFTYKFYFDKTNDVLEKIEFNAEYPPLGGTSDSSVVSSVASTIRESFCGAGGITVDNTCNVKIEGLRIFSNYEIKPNEFLENYGYKKEEGKTLLETIKNDYETRDPEGCFEMYTVSTQGCGEIIKTTCEVEERK